MKLSKDLGLFGVFSLALGTTLSGGFFLLPGIAAKDVGSGLILCYFLAAIFMVPAMVSMVELATAMPRAGGLYFFLERSLGPLAGTIGGLGTWLALTLKTAFALVGLGAYLELLFAESKIVEDPELVKTAAVHDNPIIIVIAVALAIFFGIVNLFGAKKTGQFQNFLVIGLLGILIWFMGGGLPEVNTGHFNDFFKGGTEGILAMAGVVFISYIGITKVVSVAEEIDNPERNLPLGAFLGIGTAVFIYLVGLTVMFGVIDPAEFKSNLYTPVATAANVFAGDIGAIVVSIAAILAFLSVANAGILSASRYPFAMGRDHILPKAFEKVNKSGAPTLGIFITVATIVGVILFLNPYVIAKLASTFLLLIFGLTCLSVIVMRESGLEAYDPSYHSPLYPWMQIFGLVGSGFLIFQLGSGPSLFTLGLIAFGMVWYFYYAKKRVNRHGAVYMLFRKQHPHKPSSLDIELREILKEKGLRDEDPFDHLIADAYVIEAEENDTFETLAVKAATLLAEHIPFTVETLVKGFLQGTRIGSTPVSKNVALPHLRLPSVGESKLVLVRAELGIEIDLHHAILDTEQELLVHALFFLISPEDQPKMHLRIMAQFATHIEEEGFMTNWLTARDDQMLKEVVIRDDRYYSIELSPGHQGMALVGHQIKDVQFPESCLVALIRRRGEVVVPHGDTLLEANDQLTVIGDADDIKNLKRDGFMFRAS